MGEGNWLFCGHGKTLRNCHLHAEKPGCLSELVSLFPERNKEGDCLTPAVCLIPSIPSLSVRGGSGCPREGFVFPLSFVFILWFLLHPFKSPSSPSSQYVCCCLDPAFCHCSLPSLAPSEVCWPEHSLLCLRLGVQRTGWRERQGTSLGFPGMAA